MTEINKDLPLMPKATAVWLVENTTLTFKQIAQFCGFHELEIQGIADGDVAQGINGQSPISSGQLSEEEIARCQKDPESALRINAGKTAQIKDIGKKTGKYTPVARRQDKPDGIAFLLKYYPEISNAQIRKLVGTTDDMIDSLRTKSHWNMKNIKPRDVVLLGLCNQSQFNDVIAAVKAQSERLIEKAAEKKKKPVKKAKKD